MSLSIQICLLCAFQLTFLHFLSCCGMRSLWQSLPNQLTSSALQKNIFTGQIKSKLVWCFLVVRQAHKQRSFKETAVLKLWKKNKNKNLWIKTAEIRRRTEPHWWSELIRSADGWAFRLSPEKRNGATDTESVLLMRVYVEMHDKYMYNCWFLFILSPLFWALIVWA